jgi:Domain of unknown function (DUF4214)
MTHSSTQKNDRESWLKKYFTLNEIIYGSDKHFVRTAYECVLGRPADSSGLDTYMSLLLEGKSRVEILVDLRRSLEGRKYGAHVLGLNPATSLAELLAHQDEAFTSCAFQTILGRPVDANAFASYGHQLENGADRLYLLNDIRLSGECKSSEALALALEHGAHPLRDAPTIVSGAITEVADAHIPPTPGSLTDLDNSSDRQFVHRLFQLLLARIADEDELQMCLSNMKSGVSRSGLVNSMSQSSERIARRNLFSELDAAIADSPSRRHAIFGRAARARYDKLERLVEAKKLSMMQEQISALVFRVGCQFEVTNKPTVDAERVDFGARRPINLADLSPLARDIYSQIKSGLGAHNVGSP